MRLRVFASGSKGNCLAVRAASGALVLVDCGLSHRALAQRAQACGVDVDAAQAILFTHDHSDHYAGLETFHKNHPGTALLANGDTADAIARATGVGDGWTLFETSEPFACADFAVTPFSLSHDAADPVGFLIEADGAALFVGTDTGYATLGFKDALRRAHIAVLESNYDPRLLEMSDRPVSLKRRIAGRSGHLSNDDAAALVRTLDPPHLKTLLLAHLSEQCNAPHLALEAMQAALADRGRTDVTLAALSQHEPSALYELNG